MRLFHFHVSIMISYAVFPIYASLYFFCVECIIGADEEKGVFL